MGYEFNPPWGVTLVCLYMCHESGSIWLAWKVCWQKKESAEDETFMLSWCTWKEHK